MKIIGFNFTKISAERKSQDLNGLSINTDISFEDIKKDEIPLIKEESGLKVDFKYSVSYNSQDKRKTSSQEALISLHGSIVLLSSKEEVSQILSSWKKKELPEPFKISLFNFILKKCTTKAAQLEDEINLPLHVPIPRISANAEPKKQSTN